MIWDLRRGTGVFSNDLAGGGLGFGDWKSLPLESSLDLLGDDDMELLILG